MFENFHFIRPLWLFALIPLALLAWRVCRPGGGDNPWHRIIDARLLPLLMAGRTLAMSSAILWLAAAGWIIAVLALADPTWERKPQPLFQTTAARVVVLDLSRSMDATDLRPSRLVRARYKVEDVLDSGAEGQTGLVVYAGDAFTVSPMTRDVNTIRALLKVLDPEIMPVEGRRADLGLLKAGELLRQAGVSNGQVLLVTDGVEADHVVASERAAARLLSAGYRVSVLGVGTEEGAPVTDSGGAQQRDAAGKTVVTRLDAATLQSVARAGGGQYRAISDNGEALRTLLSTGEPLRANGTVQTDAKTQGWKEQGPLLAVLLLPLAALAFRRNWLLSLILVAGLTSPPQPAMASTWDDLWQRPDQQAAKALAAGDYAKASAIATDAAHRGSAEYKRDHYQQALENFSQATGADADYNRGNALAKLGRYQEAIVAYDKSLKVNPADEDARANKAAVEALLKQQPKPQPQQDLQSHDDKPQQGQDQGKGGGQNSSQNNAQNQPPQQGKSGQGGASSGHGQQQAGAKDSTGSAQNGEPSRENDKEHQQQDAASGAGSERSQSGAPGAAQQKKPDNQFAEAAKNLASQSAQAKADENTQAQGAANGNAVNGAEPPANVKPRPQGAAAGAQTLDSEEKIAAEQWLRRIPDDPGGLLRRKFLYQYRQRAQLSNAESQ